MKKRMLTVICLLLTLLLLAGCGRRKKTAETVTIPPTETAAPAATQLPLTTAAPEPVQTPAPTPEPTPAPTAKPAANLPVVKKDPTGETVAVNGKCQFVTRYENAILAEWHFVSPDGSQDLDYIQAQNAFPTLKVLNGYTKDLTLDSIPATLNGWRVYCRFSNNSGSVNSGSALITVLQDSYAPVQRQGFEGRWAEEIAGRCQITFSYRAEGSWNVDISWSGSAWERARWNMTANIWRDDIAVYDDAHAWTETYTSDTSYTISDESFGGTGSFFIRDGKLHWVNNQTGEEIVLVPV